MLLIEQDLFGSWCLKRVFGSTVNRRGRIMIQTFDNEKEALQELTEVEYKKRQRGYIYSDMISPEHYYLRPQIISETQRQNKALKSKLAKNTIDAEQYHNPDQQDLFYTDELANKMLIIHDFEQDE